MIDQHLLPSVDVLVTGSEGFIGKHLCKRLERENLTFFEADISLGIDLCSPTAMASIPPFKVAVHLAAKSFIPDSWVNPVTFFQNNLISLLNVLEACRNYKARLIMASSYVYGIPTELPISETHPVSALNPYAQSKLTAETICQGYAQSFNIPVLIIRPFNVYGPGQDDKFLIPSIISQWKSGQVFLKDPHPKRDYLFVEDMIDAYMKALNYDMKQFEVINIGSGTSFSVTEIVNFMSQIIPEKAIITYSGEVRKNEIPETRADVGKAWQLLNWKPETSLKEGLEITIQKEWAR